MPANVRNTPFANDPIYPARTRGVTDPYAHQYYWAFKYQRDSCIVWRYDLEAGRLQHFLTLSKGQFGMGHVLGKAGLWVAGENGLTLFDRHQGAIIKQAGKPTGESFILRLQPWGDDLLVNDRWLFRLEQNRYEDFFPLPDDMKGCKSPTNTEFFGEACITSAIENGESAEYLIAAGQKAIRLPFKQHWAMRRNDLAVNPPVAWFSFPDKLLAFNYTTGDSIIYSFNTGEPLLGDQAGPFLGFRSERGLSFFDKKNGQVRMLTKNFGYNPPLHFISDQRYIYLTFEDHWEIIDFSKLHPNFKHSTILEEFEAFDLERKALVEALPEAFYAQYAVYSGLLNKYQSLNNPKIEAAWTEISKQLGYLLWQAPDSVLVRVAKEYHSGRFSPKLSCGIVQALFTYYCRKTNLKQALKLTAMPGNEACISEQDGNGDYFMALVRTTQHQLDSVKASAAPPDERMYAEGTIWWDFCRSQMGFGYLWTLEEGLQKPMSYFRKLIQKYPESPWADNAAYDTLYFIDYQPQATDDYLPPGNDNKAYQAFTQFLKDYPNSDRRPDVLVRLANVIQRGVYDAQYNNINKETADDYLYIVATEYPDFAKNSKEYQASLAQQNRYHWANRWDITLLFNKEKYQTGDSILVTVQLQNRSGSAKTLQPDFLQNWHKGLKLQLSKTVEKGCEGLWGDFPLLPIGTKDTVQAVTVQPRDFYTETFMLGQKSYTKRFYPGSFELESGAAYDYYLEFRHEDFSWLWVEAKNRGRIRME